MRAPAPTHAWAEPQGWWAGQGDREGFPPPKATGTWESGLRTGRAQNCSHSSPRFTVELGCPFQQSVDSPHCCGCQPHFTTWYLTAKPNEGCCSGLSHCAGSRRQLTPPPATYIPASSTPTWPEAPCPWQPPLPPSLPPPAFPSPPHYQHTHTAQGPALRSCKGDQLFPRSARQSPVTRLHHTRPTPPTLLEVKAQGVGEQESGRPVPWWGLLRPQFGKERTLPVWEPEDPAEG